MMTEGFLAVLFAWALIDGDYGEASLIALRWIVMAWRALELQQAIGSWPKYNEPR